MSEPYFILSVVLLNHILCILLYYFLTKEMKDNSELAPVSDGALKCTCYEDYHCEAAS